MSTPIDAIGSVLNQQAATTTPNNTINQNDFIKLFLSQLQFQDPLQPVDNEQFLAQLAEFSNLQQTTQTSQNTQGLMVLNSSAQALSLLNQVVTVQDTQDSGTTIGTVSAVSFNSSGPTLSITPTDGGPTVTGISLSQITQVAPLSSASSSSSSSGLNQ
jgi:flagellar basal-body rod modification protein FlgD